MKMNKKLMYAVVCAVGLQAAMPAHAGVWSNFSNWFSTISDSSKRTTGIVVAGLVAALGACFAYKMWSSKKAPVVPPHVPNNVAPANPAPQAEPVVQEPAAHQLFPVLSVPSQQEIEKLQNEQKAAAQAKELAQQRAAAFKKNEEAGKVLAQGAIAGANARELALQANAASQAVPHVVAVQPLSPQEIIEKEREEARIGLAQSAQRQQQVIAQEQEEAKKTVAQKATEVAMNAGQTAVDTVVSVATSPTVTNGISAAGTMAANGLSTAGSIIQTGTQMVTDGMLKAYQTACPIVREGAAVAQSHVVSTVQAMRTHGDSPRFKDARRGYEGLVQGAYIPLIKKFNAAYADGKYEEAQANIDAMRPYFEDGVQLDRLHKDMKALSKEYEDQIAGKNGRALLTTIEPKEYSQLNQWIANVDGFKARFAQVSQDMEQVQQTRKNTGDILNERHKRGKSKSRIEIMTPEQMQTHQVESKRSAAHVN